MSKTLVLGFDDSPSANAALRRTIALAGETGADVAVVFGFYITPWGGTGEGTIREAVADVGSRAVANAAAALEAAGVSCTSHLVEQKPAEALIHVAQELEAETIVVGTVGEHPITGSFLGSVVLRLVQRSPVPVLVVPTSEG